MIDTRDSSLFGTRNPMEGEVRIPSGCAIAGIFHKKGGKIGGDTIIRAMEPMHDRSNGLGGGFAGYGIYPDFADCYAFHMFYDNESARDDCEHYLKRFFDIHSMSVMPTRPMREITDPPIIWRYFVTPKAWRCQEEAMDEDAFTAAHVLHVNVNIPGAFIFSSGKNMGVFKAVGYPEDVGRFYRLDEYAGYSWTAHGRYPTNTPGWWGGAHPFALLDYSVVHNGEISSYDANRRFIEMFGYKCTLQTDTEVITYIADYLLRRQGMSLEEAANVIAAPFWSTIRGKAASEAERLTYLRTVFSSLLITGPFSIVLGFNGGLMALNDRLKLRSLITSTCGDRVYIASEEAAIRAMEPHAGHFYAPMGGEPMIVKVEEGAY